MQIGDRSFHIHDQEIFHRYKTSSRGKEEEFLFSPLKAAPNSQWLYKTHSLSVSGVHLSTPAYDADLIEQELRMWIGKPTIIIAYVLPHSRPESRGYNCACLCVGDCGCNITYLQSFGVLTEVESSVDDPYQPHELELNIDIYEFWRELDNYSWKWGSGIAEFPRNVWYADEDINYLPIRDDCGGEVYWNRFPNCEEIFNCDADCGNFIHIDWERDNIFYDELYWNEVYNNECYGRNGGASGECSLLPGSMVTINIDRGIWGAPPLSMYSLSNLPVDGELSLNVQRKNGLSVEEITSVIDLEELNDDMNTAGYGDIQTSDRLLVGDIRRYDDGVTYRPSFMQRNCEILSVRPKWTYPDWFPGMLYPGINKFWFNYTPGSGSPTQISAFYIHHFRRV